MPWRSRWAGIGALKGKRTLNTFRHRSEATWNVISLMQYWKQLLPVPSSHPVLLQHPEITEESCFRITVLIAEQVFFNSNVNSDTLDSDFTVVPPENRYLHEALLVRGVPVVLWHPSPPILQKFNLSASISSRITQIFPLNLFLWTTTFPPNHKSSSMCSSSGPEKSNKRVSPLFWNIYCRLPVSILFKLYYYVLSSNSCKALSWCITLQRSTLKSLRGELNNSKYFISVHSQFLKLVDMT